MVNPCRSAYNGQSASRKLRRADVPRKLRRAKRDHLPLTNGA
jgi:hypothetical protein